MYWRLEAKGQVRQRFGVEQVWQDGRQGRQVWVTGD